MADTGGRIGKGVGLWTLICCDCRFEFCRGHGCLSVVCCQVEVSVTSCSPIQRSPTECGVSLCDLETSTMRRASPGLDRSVTGGGKNMEK